jgi:hypothetical protein
MRRSEERVIRTLGNVQPWANLRTALADQDVASLSELPSEFLDTQALTMGIAAVP